MNETDVERCSVGRIAEAEFSILALEAFLRIARIRAVSWLSYV